MPVNMGVSDEVMKMKMKIWVPNPLKSGVDIGALVRRASTKRDVYWSVEPVSKAGYLRTVPKAVRRVRNASVQDP